MTTPMDIGLERADDEVFGLQEIDADGVGSEFDEGDPANEEADIEDSQPSDDDEYLSEDEQELQLLEESLGEAYDRHQEKQLDKDAKRKAREEARLRRHQDEGDKEWTGLQDPDVADEDESVHSGDDIEVVRQKRARFAKAADSDDGEDSDSDGEDVTEQAARIMSARDGHISDPNPKSKKKQRLLTDLSEKPNSSAEVKKRATEMWFDQPVFKDLQGVEEHLNLEDDDDDDEEATSQQSDQEEQHSQSSSISGGRVKDEQDSDCSDDDFEIVPRDPVESTIWDEEDSDQDEKNTRIIQGMLLLSCHSASSHIPICVSLM